MLSLKAYPSGILRLSRSIPFYTRKCIFPASSHIACRHCMDPKFQSIHLYLPWKLECCSSPASTQAAQAQNTIEELYSFLFYFYANIQRNVACDIYYYLTIKLDQAKPDSRLATYGGVVLERLEGLNSRFSPVMWWKLKIVTIQWIKSRIWDTIDDWYINNLAKNQVFAVFHSRVICKSVSPKCQAWPGGVVGYQYTLYFPHKIPIYLKIVKCVILNT